MICLASSCVVVDRWSLIVIVGGLVVWFASSLSEIVSERGRVDVKKSKSDFAFSHNPKSTS
jgi:hypothetical protein